MDALIMGPCSICFRPDGVGFMAPFNDVVYGGYVLGFMLERPMVWIVDQAGFQSRVPKTGSSYDT